MRQGAGPVVVVLDEADPYQRQVITGLRAALEPRGIPVLLHLWGMRQPAPPKSLVRLLRHGNARGVVAIQFALEDNQRQLDLLLQDLPTLPTVYVGRVAPGTVGRSIRSDNAAGMRMLVEHLVDTQGLHRLLLVRGPADQVDAQEREVALRVALTERGLGLPAERVVDGNFHRETAYRRVWATLQQGTSFDAVVALNDQMALGAIDAVHAYGMTVPDDVMVTGFDDEETAARALPSLTTIHQNLVQQGTMAARTLLDLAAGRPCEDVRVPVTLVTRCSTSLRGGPQPVPESELAEDVAQLRAQISRLGTSISLSRAFMSCTRVEDVLEQLGASLPRLAISRLFLVLHEEGDDGPTGVVALAHYDGAPAELGRRPFDLAQLLPDHLARHLHKGSLTLQPLLLGDQDIGYLLIDRPTESDDLINEILRLDLLRTIESVVSWRRERR